MVDPEEAAAVTAPMAETVFKTAAAEAVAATAEKAATEPQTQTFVHTQAMEVAVVDTAHQEPAALALVLAE